MYFFIVSTACLTSALILMFLQRLEAAGLALLAALALLSFQGPWKGLSSTDLRELFSDDETQRLDPLLIGGFLGFFVALYLAVKWEVASAGAVFTASLSALGVSKGSVYGVRTQQIKSATQTTRPEHSTSKEHAPVKITAPSISAVASQTTAQDTVHKAAQSPSPKAGGGQRR